MNKFLKELKAYFKACQAAPSKILYYTVTDSTNERARRYPEEKKSDAKATVNGTKGVTLFVADSQSRGRGRLERRFVSNAGSGLYMSIKFPYHGSLSDAVGITPLAAVSVCRATERLCGAKPKIKWVNDVYVGEKKLAGILTESIVGESGIREFICGIGVNISPSDMPPEVKSIATDLLSEGFSVSPAALCAKITEEFLLGLDDVWSFETVNEYKSRSFIPGKAVTVTEGNEVYSATALNVSDRYELLIELSDGSKRNLSAGEVSLKLKK